MCKWLWKLAEDDSKPKHTSRNPPFLKQDEKNHRSKNYEVG
jgi:hypothetical protein